MHRFVVKQVLNCCRNQENRRILRKLYSNDVKLSDEIVFANHCYLPHAVSLVANDDIATCLLLIERQRNGLKLANTSAAVLEVTNLAIDSPDPSVQALASTALAWIEGNYIKCGAILEGLVSKKQSLHPVFLRLAQDAFILAGKPDCAMKCVIRYPSNFQSSGIYRSSTFGMLGRGYLETGKYNEADELIRKATNVNTDRDANLIATQIECYSLSGKTSEVKAIMEDERGLYSDNGGMAQLLFGAGHASISRGNCNVAFNNLIEAFMWGPVASREGVYTATVMKKAAFLILHLLLNLTDRHQYDLDFLVKELQYHNAREHVHATEVSVLIDSIAFATHLVAFDSGQHSQLLQVKPKNEVKAVKDLLSWVRKMSTPASTASSVSPPASSSSQQTTSGNEIVAAPSATAIPFDEAKSMQIVTQDVDKQLDTLHSLLAIEPEHVNESWSITSTRKNMSIVETLYPRLTRSYPLSRAQAILSLSIAILHYAKKEYEACKDILTKLHEHEYLELGLEAMERDIVHQLFIET